MCRGTSATFTEPHNKHRAETAASTTRRQKDVAISSVHSPAKAAATGASQRAAAEFGCMPHHKKLTVSMRSTPTGCHIQFGCTVGHVAIQIPKTRHWQRYSLFACTGLMKDIVSVCSAHSQLKGAGLLNAACPGANVSTDHVVQDLLHSLLGFSVLLITQQCRRPVADWDVLKHFWQGL